MLIIGHILIPLILPTLNRIAMPDDDLEIRVQQQNDIVLHALDVKCDRRREAVVEVVLQQRGLDHHQAVGGVLTQQRAFVEGGLVRRGAEGLDEVRTT